MFLHDVWPDSDEFFVPEKNLHSAVFEVMCDAIRDEAQRVGIKGVGIVLAWRPGIRYFSSLSVIVGSIEGEPIRKSGSHVIGINHFAVANSMVSEMLLTLQPSGTNPRRLIRRGETGLRGGQIYSVESWEAYLLVAFSGGTPDENVQIATAGAENTRLRHFGIERVTIVKPR